MTAKKTNALEGSLILHQKIGIRECTFPSFDDAKSNFDVLTAVPSACDNDKSKRFSVPLIPSPIRGVSWENCIVRSTSM